MTLVNEQPAVGARIPPVAATARRAASASLTAMRWALTIALVPAVLLATWEWAARTGAVNDAFVPPPSEVLDGIRGLASAGDLWGPLATTVRRTLGGWLVATLIGVVGGAALGRSRTARVAFDPTIDFVRSVPAAAIVPVAVLLLGPGEGTEVAVVALAGTFPILLNAIQGVRTVDHVLIDAARTCHLSRRRQISQIELRSAIPSIVAGMRISLSVCFIVAVLVEMIGSTGGLGTQLIESRSRFRNEEVYGIVVTLGLVGVVINGAVELLDRRLTRWRQPR